MDLGQAKELMVELGQAGVGGISFSAGEPFLYCEDIGELVTLCGRMGIYTRMVTNCYWAKTMEAADRMIADLKVKGLNQLRLSFSRWHQCQIDRRYVLNAARSCSKLGLDYYISFITDFSEKDDANEAFLRRHNLLFFPEPMIYAGRAQEFQRRRIQTDYQANCCAMNPYLSPDLDMYACCDAGIHFTDTNFFFLGNLKDHSIETLFAKYERDRIYGLIRTMGITAMASFAGVPAREIITYSKCELCRMLFNNPECASKLQAEVAVLEAWHR
jgi:hypothetical protein